MPACPAARPQTTFLVSWLAVFTFLRRYRFGKAQLASASHNPPSSPGSRADSKPFSRHFGRKQVVSVAFALQWKTDTHTLSVLGFDLDISAQAEETRGISICSLPTKSPWSVLTAAFLPDTGLYWKRFAALGK